MGPPKHYTLREKILSFFFQQFFAACLSPAHPGAAHQNRTAEALGNLLIRKTLLIEKQQDFPLFRGKPCWQTF